MTKNLPAKGGIKIGIIVIHALLDHTRLWWNFQKKILGGKYFLIVSKFDRIRKNRNYLIYGSALAISETEANNIIVSAKKFVSEAEKIIQKNNPPKRN